ncbi:kinase-like domain-containing protein [Apodospora peruviana]|uniref:non-specific serine/threonine protein kinase n=1 Tax=Apodospora peruviana TaxID=516989 RepID=A0AAE0I474_9PEZI|nr:kinase-like domain-containing protein [Apodospora peruviana]
METTVQEPEQRDTVIKETSQQNATDPAPRDENPQSSTAVRFKSTIEEIDPKDTTSGVPAAIAQEYSLGDPSEVTPEQIRDLSNRLKACPLQERRMNIFNYEAFSLPASRTASHDDDSRVPSREGSRSSTSRNSPHLRASRRSPDAHTPPLTPAGTDGAEAERGREVETSRSTKVAIPDILTPQDSTHEPLSPGSVRPSSQVAPSTDQVSRRPASPDEKELPLASVGDHRKGLFTVGGRGGSPTGSSSASRESSPSRAAAAASQFYSRQAPPGGDAHDPYAANKRQVQKGIDPRFIFSRKKKAASPGSSTINLPRLSSDKRGGRKEELQQDDMSIHTRNSSMADLKRFFKLGASSKARRPASPAASVRSGLKTPPSSKSSQIPFGDDHGLTSKYGKLGKVLGAGAGGSVRLMKRNDDGVVFAVKEFRPRHSYETEREYVKKLTAEYCMGSSLHHGNIIETLDIVQEKGKWYDVMEYAPYDLFAIVMTGKMSREEVSCCFLQILSGVTYLHSMGLAHRDLKLDNVVVSERGIMKIIDFGSAHVFKYPFENGIVPASGIVGSDPYLAPEVYDERKYDPQAVDIWSLAIIYCCMTLRRFPWKVPRMTDSSFKLFAAEPTPGHDPKKLIAPLPPALSTTALTDLPARDFDPQKNEDTPDKSGHEAKSSSSLKPPGGGSTSQPADSSAASGGGGAPQEKKEVVRGPWRILRLLPRESRHVIGRMLEIDPKKRAQMSEILDDPWVADTVICRQIEGGEVVNADDHTHILEPPASVGSSSAK